ncbi:MAG: GNAT family N-acetyltransferase [Bacteroidaceae bacterium]|nr:GNAT family N-acetyltransferase [Bacteroidaceae bacterium]
MIVQEWKSIGTVRINISTSDNLATVIVDVIKEKTPGQRFDVGDAVIWNLCVHESCRGERYGRQMLADAELRARQHGAKTAYLEWDGRDSAKWVLDWYRRSGYEEAAFGENYELLKKEL